MSAAWSSGLNVVLVVNNVSKPTRAIMLCSSERHFTVLFPASGSWHAVLNFTHICNKLKNQNKKFQLDSNILASPKAVRGNCLPYV